MGSLFTVELPALSRLAAKVAWALALALGCVALGALAVIFPFGQLAEPLLIWIATIALAAGAWRTTRHRSLSAMVLIYGFLGYGVAAALFYRPTAEQIARRVSGVTTMAAHTSGYEYLPLFVAAAGAIWIASFVVSLPPIRPSQNLSNITFRLSPWILGLAFIPLIFEIYGTGVHTLFYAEGYLDRTGPLTALRMGHLLAPLGILICAYFLASPRQPVLARSTALLLALAYEAVSLAGSSRTFAIWFPLLLLGAFLGRDWTPRQRGVAIAVTLVVTIAALEVPLTLRGLSRQGLIPNVDFLIHKPGAVFDARDPLNNLLFGAPISLFIAQHTPTIPSGDTLAALNPLPSRFTNWYEIAPAHRLNAHNPYSALGELGNQGWLLFVLVFGCAGIGFAFAERLARRTSGTLGLVARFAVVVSTALFVARSTEYDLRTVSRFVYYLLVLNIALLWLSRSRSHQSPKRDAEPTLGMSYGSGSQTSGS